MCNLGTLIKVAWTVMLLLFYSGDSYSNCSNDGELIFANTLCRHGDRNLFRTYPDDPWKDESYWQGGYSQLTNVGKQQHYILGQYLRKRYSSLLGTGEYSANRVYIRSTDTDRTIMSALANLAGMFPPANHQLWNENLQWHPIPVHTQPSTDDYLLATSTHCDRFDYLMVKYLNESNYEGLLRQYSQLIDYLETRTTLKLDSLTEIMLLYDAFHVEQLKGYWLPIWARHIMVNGGNLEFLATLWYQIHTSTNEMKKIKAGYLLKDILNRFTDKIESKLSPDRTLFLYFAHDITIANILNSMGLFKMHIPPYASCVFFELYKTNSSHYVQIYYKNSIETDIPALEIPNCGTKCPLEKLYALYNEILPTQSFDKECLLREGEVSPPGGNPVNYSV